MSCWHNRVRTESGSDRIKKSRCFRRFLLIRSLPLPVLTQSPSALGICAGSALRSHYATKFLSNAFRSQFARFAPAS